MFKALADPSRRALLDALFAEDGQSLTGLEEQLPMTRFGVAKHLKVLEQAGLVVRGREAQYRPCALDPAPLEAVSSWAEQYRPVWEARFDRMDAYLAGIRDDRKGNAK